MTGYGRGTSTGATFAVTVELRSVNNRNLDIHWRAPQELLPLEIPLKKRVQSAVTRGRVDVSISISQSDEVKYELNRPLIRGYLEAMRAIQTEFGLAGQIDLGSIVRIPGALQTSSTNGTLSPEVTEAVDAALLDALNALLAMRSVEGQELQKELTTRISRIESQLSLIEADSAHVVEQYREKLTVRLAEILGAANIDEGRLAQEVAYLAERGDITEEITRLKSHLVQLKELLSREGEIGKKLDFLLQEANREANTILSKSSELTVCDAAIEIKADVEKLREQSQNVE